ncbi:MAG: hypothetical protein GY925_03330 [Actinomycetia bacterium]|nr:hypothetical protein [Actinomycetes bacterium]
MIAAVSGGAISLWRLEGGGQLGVPDWLTGQDPCGVSALGGVLVAHRVLALSDEGATNAQVVRLDDGEVLGATELDSIVSRELGQFDAAMIGEEIRVVAGVPDHFRTWDPGVDDLVEWDSPYTDEVRESMRAVAIGDTEGKPVVVSSRHLHGTAVVKLTEVMGPATETATSANVDAYREVVGEHEQRLWRMMPEPPKSSPDPVVVIGGEKPVVIGGREAADVSDPETWPRTCYREVRVDGRDFVATGSRAGSAFLWDPSDGSADIVSGPFRSPDPYLLRMGAVKGGPESTRDVDAELHPELGLVVGIADGDVGVFRTEGGTELDIIDLDPGEVQTVALGDIDGMLILATGSEGGKVTVSEVRESGDVEFIADFPLDEPIAQVWVPEQSNRVEVRPSR